jgi:signal transduction histidine kinase
MNKEETYLIFKGIEMISSENDLIGVLLIQDGYNIYANKGLANILESSINEILTMERNGFYNGLHPEDLDPAKEYINSTLIQNNTTTTPFSCRIISKSGRIRWTKILSKPIEYRDNVAILLTMQDYTELVELSSNTEKNDYRDMKFDLDLDQLLDENPLLGISIFQDNRIKYVNHHLSDIIGHTFIDLMSMTVYDVLDLIPFEYRSLIKLNFQDVENGSKDTLDITYPIYHKNGTKIWVHSYGRRFNFMCKPAVFTLTKFISTYRKIETKNGKPINLEESFVDNTMRNELEQNLSLLNIKLQEINKLKSELLYRISHELKTPLIPVKGYADLLLRTYKGKLDEDVIAYLQAIMGGSERLEKLINELLESSSLEKDQVTLNLQEGDLTSLIKHTLEQLDDVIQIRNHSIILNLNDEILTKFDEEKMKKALSNLILNAINYTPKNGQIQIGTDIKNSDIIICIKDDGIGLTNEEKHKLFKQFGKIERYGKGWDIGTEGPGFGLYNSKKIIELHGGRIWVESEGKNQGSTFCFSIPII